MCETDENGISLFYARMEGEMLLERMTYVTVMGNKYILSLLYA